MRKQKRADCQKIEPVLFQCHGESFRSLAGEGPCFVGTQIVYVHQLDALAAFNLVFCRYGQLPKRRNHRRFLEKLIFAPGNIGDRNKERAVIADAEFMPVGDQRQFSHGVIKRARQRCRTIKKLDTGLNRQLNGILVLQVFRSGWNIQNVQEKDRFTIRR